VRLCFTCDEEIGRGVDHLDPAKVGAAVCYTLDGQGADTIDVETFSADLATVTLRGVNIHPGIAKAGWSMPFALQAISSPGCLVRGPPRKRRTVAKGSCILTRSAEAWPTAP